MVDPPLPDLGDRPRLDPVPVAPERVAGQRDDPPGGLEHRPVDLDAEVVERGQRGGEGGLFVLLAADRGQGPRLWPVGRARVGLDGLLDRAAEHRVRADLQEQAVAVVGEPLHGLPEADAVADVVPPVPGVQLGAARGALAAGEVERGLRRAGLDVGERLQQLVLDQLHPGAVVRDFDGQRPGEDLLGGERGGQLGEGGSVPGEGERGGAVHGGDRHPAPVRADPAQRLGLGERDREHAAGAYQLLLEPAAVEHHLDRVGEVVDPGLVEGGDLAGGVADDRVRPHAPAAPERGQAGLDGEVGGLGEPGLGHPGRRLVGGELVDQRPAYQFGEVLGARLDGLPVDRFGGEQPHGPSPTTAGPSR